MNDVELMGRIKSSMEHFTFDEHPVTFTRPTPGPSARVRLAGVAIAVALATGLFISTSLRPAPLFASWSVTPSVADPALAAAAVDLCVRDLPGSADAELLVQDQRGSAAAILYRVGDSAVSCVLAVEGSGRIVAASAAASRITPKTGALSVDGWSVVPAGDISRGDTGLARLFGRAPAGTSSVIVSRSDGTIVTATVAHGYFLAWWPSDEGATAIDARDASGKVISHVSGPGAEAAG